MRHREGQQLTQGHRQFDGAVQARLQDFRFMSLGLFPPIRLPITLSKDNCHGSASVQGKASLTCEGWQLDLKQQGRQWKTL